MAMTADELRVLRSSVIQQLGDGVQQIRYPDGSGVTYVDAATARARLEILDREIAAIGGVPHRGPTYRRVEMRRC
jgi:hypothetical protein